MLPLHLTKGWNSFSIPADPMISEPDEFFGTHKVGCLWSFDNGKYSVAHEIRAGIGYMVYADAEIKIVYPCREATMDTISIVPGWNFIGTMGPCPALTNGSTPQWAFANGHFHETTRMMEVGRGYWIYSDKDSNVPVGSNGSDSDSDGLPDYWESLWDFIPNVSDSFLNPDQDFVPNLLEYKQGTNPYASDTDADGLQDWGDHDVSLLVNRVFVSAVTNEDDFIDFRPLNELLNTIELESSITVEGAEKIRQEQLTLKTAIEALPEDQWSKYRSRFNEFITRGDAIIATKGVLVPFGEGKEFTIINHTDLMLQLTQRYRLMDESDGTLDFTRFAGVSHEDVDGLDLLSSHLKARSIGPNFDMPIFDLLSPLGHLQLLSRLIAKYAAQTGFLNPEQSFNTTDFLRFVDGTKPAFDKANAAAANVFSNHAIIIPESPLTIPIILDTLHEYEALNRDQTTVIKDALDRYDGEEVFRNILISQITSEINYGKSHNPSYSELWQAFTDRLKNTAINYMIDGKTITIHASQLHQFTNELPFDSATLFQYPGVLADLNPSLFTGLISREFYQQLQRVHGPPSWEIPIPSLVDLKTSGQDEPSQFSYPARRFQLLEILLKTWQNEVINSSETIDLDRIRSKLLLNDALEADLDAADMLIAEKVDELQSLGSSAALTQSDYGTMKAILRDVRMKLNDRFSTHLESVIFSTKNELLQRINPRYQTLVSEFQKILRQALIRVPMDNGDDLIANPRTIKNDVFETVLQAIAIRINQENFSRNAYLRLNGIDQETLEDLLSPFSFSQWLKFRFETILTNGNSNEIAEEEILYHLIPRVIKRFATIDLDELTKQLSVGLAFPVEPGNNLELTLRTIVNELSSETLAAMRLIHIETIDDVLTLKTLFTKYHEALFSNLGMFSDSLTELERLWLENWINWNGRTIHNLRSVRQLFDQKMNEINYLLIDTTMVPVKDLLNIPRFPWSKDYDTELFVGILEHDMENVETQTTANQYRFFRFFPAQEYPNSSLTRLGRIQLIDTITRRLLTMLESPSEIFPDIQSIFVKQGDQFEVDREPFRRYLKGVPAMQERVLRQAQNLINNASASLETAIPSPAIAEDMMSAYDKTIGQVRNELIQLLEEEAGKHERPDVIAVENPISLIFQKELFDEFVKTVRNTQFIAGPTSQPVLLPVEKITTELLKDLRNRFGQSIAAHHFASYWGIGLDRVRGLHKLENYLNDQVIALPSHSEFVKIVSQISELGFIQLSSHLVNKFQAEVMTADGQIDVELLITLLDNRDRAITDVKDRAETIQSTHMARLHDLDTTITMSSLEAMSEIMEDAKLDLSALMNDFLSGIMDDDIKTIRDQLEAHINTLFSALKQVRDTLLQDHEFQFEVEIDGSLRAILTPFNETTVGRFIQFVDDYGQRYPSTDVTDEFPTNAFPPEVDFETNVSMPEMDILPIWYPIPEYDPKHHPTEFGMSMLFARLLVKFGEFIVLKDANELYQVDMELFESELVKTNEDRAIRRLDKILQEQLPIFTGDLEAHKNSKGAVAIASIAEINERMLAIKAMILPLADDAYERAREVWDEFIRLYESTLFAGILRFEIGDQEITFEAAALHGILINLYENGKIDVDFLGNFRELIEQGENRWDYYQFRNIHIIHPFFDPFDSTDMTVQLEDLSGLESQESAAGTFTMGDLARIPGINTKDLSQLDVAEKDRLQITLIEPAKLLGLLNIRALAPGSGVNAGGIFPEGDSSIPSADPTSDSGAPTVNLNQKSIRFRLFDLIPAMIEELGPDILDDDGNVIKDAFQAAICQCD